MNSFACKFAGRKCFDKEEENELLGVDVAKIKEDYRNCADEENFKCEVCEFTSSAMQDAKEHFLKTHRHNHQLDCWKCDKKVKTIIELSKHFGTLPKTKVKSSLLMRPTCTIWCCF